jgi:hypothetical protein
MELFESDDRFRTRTQYTPVSLRYFHPSGFVGQVDATYVDQSANDQSGNRLGEDEFLLINAESVTGYQSATGSYGSVLETSSTRSSAIEISTIAQHNSVPPPAILARTDLLWAVHHFILRGSSYAKRRVFASRQIGG